MHYHNVFLVQARGKKSAIGTVKLFLSRFQYQEWDWYQFGGRWMWSDLMREHEDEISKPSEDGKCRFYINPYHDEEYKDKTVNIEFPDGTIVECKYGNDVSFAIKSWVAAHPHLSEVKDATDPKFFEIIEELRGFKDTSLKSYRRPSELEKDNPEFREWREDKAQKLETCNAWTNETHFWNITDDSFDFDREEILKDPKHWFIVNVDLHN